MRRANLNKKTFGDLLVIGEPVQRNRHKRLYWPCQCLRPIHKGEEPVIRYVPSAELTRGDAISCLACTEADRKKTAAEVRHGAREVLIAKPRGCKELLCSVFHNPDCSALNLFPQARWSQY